ncbi:hypothetical protein HDU81_005679 [Chytriomyces hyalinus]|nr:hypothetical protein HDU81_005679 [Chytriomyces hyalinus]
MSLWQTLLLLLLQQTTAQTTTPSGCYLLATIPSTSFKSDSMVPELCTQQCGPSQLALIAPTVENIWDFYCACVSSVPAVAASIECTVKCPGADIPSQAPPCGGSVNGQISWSAYGNLAPSPPPATGFGFVAPPETSDVPSETSGQPTASAATVQPTVTNTVVGEDGRTTQQSVTSYPLVESSPLASAAAAVTTAKELGSSKGSGSDQSSDHLHPSSTLNSTAAPKGAIAPPTNQDEGGNTFEKNNGVTSIGFIAGGFIAGIVILAVGFTVMIQQRKPPLLPKTLGSQQYGDQTGLIRGRNGSDVDPFDGDSVSSVSIPAQTFQPNISYSKNDSPPVLLYGLASKSTTVDTLTAPEVSFGSPSRMAALGAMPDTLKTALNSNETLSLATVPINAGAGAGGSIHTSYYSGASLYSPLSKLYRSGSVAASSLFMRGMARNMAGEEGVRGVRQDVLFTQRRS